MMQQNVTAADLVENICRIEGVQAAQSGMGYGLMEGVVQFRVSPHLELH